MVYFHIQEGIMVNNCPECESKFRPYGDDLLEKNSGGLYYKFCESCRRAYAFAKLDDTVNYEGSLEGLLFFKASRASRGFI